LARRREVLHGLLGTAAIAALAAACGPVLSAPSPRTYRIGLLGQRVPQCVVPSDWEIKGAVAIKTAQTRPPDLAFCVIETGYLDALERRGYRQGGNLEWIDAIPAANGATDVASLVPPAVELVARRVEIIITLTAPATRAALQATTTIPIVCSVQDILDIGLVSDLAHPGGNLTGTSGRLAEEVLKRIELLKEAFPAAKAPILVYGDFETHVRALAPSVEGARRMGLSAVPVLLTGDGSEFLVKMRKALDDGADSLVVIGSHPGTPEFVLPLAKERRLPSVLGSELIELSGVLIGFSALRDYDALADYVDRILKGARPGDLPIVQRTTFELVVNLKEAGSQGLTVAPSVLARATRVIR
jgi:putative ABC transport system substrate-binding protein